MKWIRVSLIAQAVLAVYFQAIQWLPLGRWNRQPGFTPFAVQLSRGGGSAGDFLVLASFAIPFLLFWFASSRRLKWLMWICTAGYAVWLALQIKTWWIAYVLGASDSWREVYGRVFSHATQLLPTFGRHLPPDGMHLVLQILLVAVVASAAVGLLRSSDSAGPAWGKERGVA
jgi:hypothetical protein